MKKFISALLISSFFLLTSNPLLAVEPTGTISAATAVKPSMTNRIIVKYRANSAMASDMGAASTMLNRIVNISGATMQHHHNMSGGAQVWKLDKNMTAADARSIADQIARDPSVEYAEPDIMMYPMFTPNDSRYNEQWHYFEATAGLNLPQAWDRATGQGAVVAVIDTGYRPHADLVANILPGYDMITSTSVANDGNGRDSDARDPGDGVAADECGVGRPARNSSWHGTHVSGTIAAVTNNSIGVAGVAYNAKILPVRVLGKCGGFTSDIADAVVWAAGASVAGVPANTNPADVINMSLGGGGACGTTMQNAINQATSLGTTVVVAAGNSNQDASNFSPASCNGVVTVAAINRSGGRSYYSNFGATVEIAAPGGDTRSGAANGILSTLNTGSTSPGADSYNFYQGTSMASPHVAGLAALLYSAKASITPSEVLSTLTSTARTFPATCSGCGAGIADATAAVNAVLGGGTVPTNVLKNGIPVNNLAASRGQELHYTMDVPAGASSLQFKINGGSGDADIYVKFGSKPTTTSYDFRPYLSGNTETVNVPTAQTGTYYVMVRAYATFSGVSLTGSFSTGTPPPAGSFFENTTNYGIQDLQITESPLSINRSVAAGSLAVRVDIKHTYIGDLVIDLISPSGRVVSLKTASNDSSNDLLATYTVNTSAENSGLWILRVNDVYRGDTGFIDAWSITLP
jgi:serine protease